MTKDWTMIASKHQRGNRNWKIHIEDFHGIDDFLFLDLGDSENYVF